MSIINCYLQITCYSHCETGLKLFTKTLDLEEIIYEHNGHSFIYIYRHSYKLSASALEKFHNWLQKIFRQKWIHGN